MQASAISAVVAPVVEACGLELDDVTVVPAGKRSVLRITVDGDGPHGRGPSLDEIAKATRAISHTLDESDVTGNGSYTLEVSTRGTAAPLLTPAHWRRNRGRLVTVTLAEGSLTGRIKGSDDAGVTLDVDGTPRTLSYDEIGKAIVQVELNRPYDPELDGDQDAADDELDEDAPEQDEDGVDDVADEDEVADEGDENEE